MRAPTTIIATGEKVRMMEGGKACLAQWNRWLHLTFAYQRIAATTSTLLLLRLRRSTVSTSSHSQERPFLPPLFYVECYLITPPLPIARRQKRDPVRSECASFVDTAATDGRTL